MNAVRVERNCELRDRLRRFTPLYWWLEYWGDWLGPGGDTDYAGCELSPIAKAMKRGRDWIASTGDAQQWNDDLKAIERALGTLKMRERELERRSGPRVSAHRCLYLLHNRKWNMFQIEGHCREYLAGRLYGQDRNRWPRRMGELFTWREHDTTLWYGYSYIEAALDIMSPGFVGRPAPIWE